MRSSAERLKKDKLLVEASSRSYPCTVAQATVRLDRD